jgi:hypothetical protein
MIQTFSRLFLLACLALGTLRAEPEPPPDLLDYARSIEREHAEGRVRAVTRRFDLTTFEKRMRACFPEGQRDSQETKLLIESGLSEYESDAWGERLKGTKCRFTKCRWVDDHWRLVFRYTGLASGDWTFFEFFVHPGEFYPWEIFDWRNYTNGTRGSEMSAMMSQLVSELRPKENEADEKMRAEQSEWLMSTLAALSGRMQTGDWPKVLKAMDRLPPPLQADPMVLTMRMTAYSHVQDHAGYLGVYERLKKEFPKRDLGELSVFGALLSADALEEAEKVLRRLRETVGEDRSLDYLTAQLALRKGDETAAEGLFRGMIANEPDLYLGYLGLIARLPEGEERSTLLKQVEERFGEAPAAALRAAADEDSKSAEFTKLFESAPLPGDAKPAEIEAWMNEMKQVLARARTGIVLESYNCAFDFWPGAPWQTVRDVEPDPKMKVPILARRPSDGTSIALMISESQVPVSLDGGIGEKVFISGLVAAQRAQGAEILKQEKIIFAGHPCFRLHARVKNDQQESHFHAWYFAVGKHTYCLLVSAQNLAEIEREPDLASAVASFRFLNPDATAVVGPPAPDNTPLTKRVEFGRWHCSFGRWPDRGWIHMIEEPTQLGEEDGAVIWMLRGSATPDSKLAVICNVVVNPELSPDAFSDPFSRAVLLNSVQSTIKSEGREVFAIKNVKVAGRDGIELRASSAVGMEYSRTIMVPGDGQLISLIVETTSKADLDHEQVEDWVNSFEVAASARPPAK